jgi:pimeloyl-ACP methyl ester carboxylesterase
VTPYVIGVSWGGANWAEILTGFGTLVIGLGAFAAAYGAMAAARQLRESEKARHIALAVEMSRRWDSPALVTLRRSLRGITPSAFLQRYETARQANSQDFYNLQLLANFFEDLGALVKMDCLSVDLVDTTLGNSVTTYWETWKPAVLAHRPEWDGLYDNWEALYNDIKALPHRAGQHP